MTLLQFRRRRAGFKNENAGHGRSVVEGFAAVGNRLARRRARHEDRQDIVAKPIPKPSRVPVEDPSSRRRTRRKPGAIPCLITFAGLRLSLPARILDMSVGGACVHLPQAAKSAYDGDVDSLPERLTLHIKSDHMAYEGRIAWRSNDRIGIQFTSPPKFTR